MAEFPDLDEDEAAAMVAAFVAGVRKLEDENRKFKKLLLTGPKRKLEYISGALTAAREAIPGMTQEKVWEANEWSPSKIIRIEGGTSAASKPDILALAKLYGLDQATTEHLIKHRKG